MIFIKRMSLAMSAAPFDTNDNQNYNSYNQDTLISRKKNNHNKTQKRNISNNFNSQKVNSVLASIHNTKPDDDDNAANYNNNRIGAPVLQEYKPINPMNPPESMRQLKEGMHNKDDDGDGLVPKPVDQEDLELQELQSNFMNDAQVRDYYRKLVPNYNHSKFQKSENNKNYYPLSQQDTQGFTSSSPLSSDNNQVLIDKLNYMINLLEEQKDEKTNNVTEEVVLYSFLGIFIIFVVDSFARVGKYVR